MNSQNSLTKKVVLCGGGTGGHVFPNIAVAEILKEKNCELFYIGVNGKVEEKICEEHKLDFYGYDFQGFPRKFQKELFSWPLNLLKAISKAKLYLKHFKPDVVFGTGGYSSAPVFIAAKRLGIPYIVHNLDVRLGLANKFCANGAELLTLGFETDCSLLKSVRAVVTGNPVRKAFYEASKMDKIQLCKKFGFAPDKKIIFIVGGSQGASVINEKILEILKDLILVNDIQVVHQTGESSHEEFCKRIPCKVLETNMYHPQPFFNYPEECYFVSDLIISRAGAMTTTEICTLGKPAIFIPYPYAGNHQEANINHLINAGGAVLLRQKGLRAKELISTVLELISDPARLQKMSGVMKSFAKPDAAEKIAGLILTAVGKKDQNYPDVKNLTNVV